jgi:WD40 repeat protein
LSEGNPTHLDNPCYSSADFSPDGRYIAASHRDGMVRVWDARTGQLMRRVKAHMCRAYDVMFMPNRKGLVSGGKDMTLKYWDLSSLYHNTRIRGRSQTTDSLDGHVSAVEEQTRPIRQFSGHKVRSSHLPSFAFHETQRCLHSFNRILSAALQSHPMAGGIWLV